VRVCDTIDLCRAEKDWNQREYPEGRGYSAEETDDDGKMLLQPLNKFRQYHNRDLVSQDQ
jgi:hypothetical protein